MKKVILITGTNSGFGYLHTHTLSKAGHIVYATMRNSTTSNRESAEQLSKLPNVTVIETDLSSHESVAATVNQIIKKEGRLDVLVNNAGNFISGIAETFSDEDIDALFNIHVKATWRTIKAVLPQMRKQKDGLIINTSSVLGRFSSPFMAFYNAAKFAVEGISEGLHYEVRPLGIDVAIIEPGAYPTEIFSKSSYGSDTTLAAEYGNLAGLPEQIGHGISQLFENAKPNPQDVADAVLHLVSLPQSKRPLRTVVDSLTGNFVKETNDKAAGDYQKFVSAFGLGDLLH
ncbi:SDR family oxidoreductase [Flavobacterium sp. CYK-4]|uniref:SDR family oxidoreductase n=1 Tax=Flavobacterium lotistagni TaxID=2709660 RepID=UPI001407DE11|nr:SDR family oxidoreductase [Flavobacterium lotistagni]NHM07080.1 SDR family oxidoreductase [Flavobacterium lotistagni]